MTSLTTKQNRVFEYICDFCNENNCPPSYKEIQTKFNFSSTGTVRTYLEKLEEKGFITRRNKARGYKINQKTQHSIPILGEIAAGEPILAQEAHENKISDLSCLKFKSTKFCLIVKGHSMIDAGILDQDIAIIDKSIQVNHNEIAAVLVNNEATLKRLIVQKNSIILKSENKNYPDIKLNKYDTNIILGKYIGLIRETI